jgi:hypothetical protein
MDIEKLITDLINEKLSERVAQRVDALLSGLFEKKSIEKVELVEKPGPESIEKPESVKKVRNKRRKFLKKNSVVNGREVLYSRGDKVRVKCLNCEKVKTVKRTTERSSCDCQVKKKSPQQALAKKILGRLLEHLDNGQRLSKEPISPKEVGELVGIPMDPRPLGNGLAFLMKDPKVLTEFQLHVEHAKGKWLIYRGEV